jgi:hypothetical protein
MTLTLLAPTGTPAAGIRSRPVPLAPVTEGDTALGVQLLEASQFVAVSLLTGFPSFSTSGSAPTAQPPDLAHVSRRVRRFATAW